MLSRDQPPRLPATPLRVLAGLLALLIFALVCAVQSPAAHAWLHGGHAVRSAGHPDAQVVPDGPDEAGCPVTLFAQGLTVPLVTPVLDVPRLLAAPQSPPTPAAVAAAAPGRLHPPAQAPPALA